MAPNYISNQYLGNLTIQGQPINQRIIDFRQKYIDSPDSERLLKELRSRREVVLAQLTSEDLMNVASNQKLKEIDLSNFGEQVWEDTDTLRLRPKWWQLWKDDVSIRLAGIDAPEIAHPGEEEFRYHPEMPYGRESLANVQQFVQDKDLRVFIDPSQQTYGRYIGSVFANETNINLEAVRQGWAASLPFGEAGSDILNRDLLMREEEIASQQQLGMWSEPYFQRYLAVSKGIKGRITFNTMTEIERLAKNYNLAAMESYLSSPGTDINEQTGYRIGRSLRKSYGRFFDKSASHAPQFSARDDEWNTIEALRHGGLAESLRKRLTDFGSGYDIMRAIAKNLGKTFEQLIGSKEWKRALSEATFVRELGEGLTGTASEYMVKFAGKEIPIAKKAIKEGADANIELLVRMDNPGLTGEALQRKIATYDVAKDLHREAKFYEELGETPLVPSLYGKSTSPTGMQEIFMERMPGKPVAEYMETSIGRNYNTPPVVPEVYKDIQETLNVMEQKGLVNWDIHTGNVLYGKDPFSGQMRASWIDFGLAREAYGTEKMFTKEKLMQEFAKRMNEVGPRAESMFPGLKQYLPNEIVTSASSSVVTNKAPNIVNENVRVSDRVGSSAPSVPARRNVPKRLLTPPTAKNKLKTSDRANEQAKAQAISHQAGISGGNNHSVPSRRNVIHISKEVDPFAYTYLANVKRLNSR